MEKIVKEKTDQDKDYYAWLKERHDKRKEEEKDNTKEGEGGEEKDLKEKVSMNMHD